MPYKISGTKSDTARIIVIKESDWSIESNTVVSGSGAYEIDSLVSGTKTVIGRNEDGWAEGYGSVEAESYMPLGDRALCFGGYPGSAINTIEYISISTTGDSQDFGDLLSSKYQFSGTSNGSGDRGVTMPAYSAGNVIEYVTISTPGNAQDFGDCTESNHSAAATSNSSGDRGIRAGGYNALNTIDYITISTTGDATNFGDLTLARSGNAGTSNFTNNRAIFAGQYIFGGAGNNLIDYITVNSIGDATDFGDLTRQTMYGAFCSNGTNERGVFGGGASPNSVSQNIIDYVTINSTGNASDFGDLSHAFRQNCACSNGTDDRGIFFPGTPSYNTIDYITISVTSNSSDFGDVSSARYGMACCSNA